MQNNNLHAYRSAIADFVDFAAWQNPISLTLTYKKCIWPEPYLRVWLDEYEASQNLRHFLNVLNNKLVSHGDRRRGVRIGTYGVFEVDKNGRPHCHAMIECPDREMIEKLPGLVARLWPMTTWGYRETKVKSCYDDGWLDYITKLRTKLEYTSANDWLAYTPPTKKVSQLRA